MANFDIEKLRFPIGKFKRPESFNQEQINNWINNLEEFPLKLLQLCSSITEDQLDWQYRPDGWNIRQIIHHCADSHMNSLIRFKWALTEDQPTIKAYFEDKWAELHDSKSCPIAASLSLLDGLHERWVHLLKSLSEEDLHKSFIHPQSGKQVLLYINVALYSWHCDHHYAHILLALEHEGKYKSK